MRPEHILAVVICIAGCAADEDPSAAISPGAPPADAPRASTASAPAGSRIDAELLRAVVAEIASDAYEGRSPGSAGDERTRAYLERALAELGFSPGGGEGQWQQPFELIGIDTAQPARWAFTSDRELALRPREDFVVVSGVQRESARIRDAEVVFVGYGIQAPENAWDDFKGVDLRGKVLLMLNNDPDWDPELFAGERRLYYGRWTYKYESAARQGAAGAIIVHTTPSAGYPWQVVETSNTGAQFELPAGDEPRMELAAWVTESAAASLAELGGHELAALVEAARSREFEPVPLGIRTSIELTSRLSRTSTANVLGMLEGSDPELRDEVVIYTAHHDHLGIGEPNPADPSDRIYNGARDNASGVAEVLAIGKAFASLPERPRRSVLLAFVGAEEQNLLGSQYYAEHPTVPPGKIAANINLDANNIWGIARDITFIGLGKSSLDDVAYAVAERQGRIVKPDQFPDRGFFYRSDQFNFAKIGVPAMYLDEGTEYVGRPEGWGVAKINEHNERDYHQPSDELTPEWSFDGMAADAEFALEAGILIANADSMPTWNAGDEFEAARRRAIEALE